MVFSYAILRSKCNQQPETQKKKKEEEEEQ